MNMINLAIIISHMEDGGAQRIVLNNLRDFSYSDIVNAKLFVLGKKTKSLCNRIIKNEQMKVCYLGTNSQNLIIKTLNRLIMPFRLFFELKRFSTVFIHGHLENLIKLIFIPLIFLKFNRIFITLHSKHRNNNGLNRLMVEIGFKLLRVIPVFLNKEQANMLQKYYGFKKYEIIHNGVDFEKIRNNIVSKEEARKLFGVREKTFVLCACGRLDKVKNYPLMFDIFNKLLLYIKQNGLPRHLKMARNDDSIFVDAVLLIAGDGPEKESLVKYTEKLGISDKVKFLGNLDNVVPLYCSADVFLLTSHSESMSLVLMEAQTCGCKCFISAGVPKESIITDKVVSMKEDASVEDWVNAILTEKVTYEKPIFTEADYEVHAMSQKCKEMYLKYLKVENQ